MYRGVGYFILAVLIVIVALVIAAWRDRRRIAQAADNAAVATLAAGVRASRKITGKASSYRQRVIEKADERESRKPD